jgi:hypothetical protein
MVPLEELMPWLRRESLRRIACLLPVLALIVFCGSCSDFWVSDSSIASVAVSPTSLLLKAAASDGTGGDTYSLSASATSVGGTTTDETTSAAWTSSVPAAVTVGASTGKLTVVGSAAATSVIKATFGGQSGTANILIFTGTAPSSIAINFPTSIVPSSIATGATFQVTATTTLDGNSNTNISSYVTWSSNATAIATVDTNGNVTVLTTAGTFTITATANLAGGSVTGTSTTFTVI